MSSVVYLATAIDRHSLLRYIPVVPRVGRLWVPSNLDTLPSYKALYARVHPIICVVIVPKSDTVPISDSRMLGM
jgi:hypothetical protein